jgi:hypothetical protein
MHITNICFILSLLFTSSACTNKRGSGSVGTVKIYGAPEGISIKSAELLKLKEEGLSDTKLVELASKASFSVDDIVNSGEQFAKLPDAVLNTLVDKIKEPGSKGVRAALKSGFNDKLLKKMVEKISPEEAREVLNQHPLPSQEICNELWAKYGTKES